MSENSAENPKYRWGKFYWKDWLADVELRSCSPAARAIWMDMLCLASEGEPYGFVTFNGKAITMKRLGAISGVSEKTCEKLVSELAEAGVFSVENGVIFCRRMVKDRAASEAGRRNGKGGGNPLLKPKEDNPDVSRGLTPGDTAGVKLESESESESETEKEDGGQKTQSAAPSLPGLPADARPDGRAKKPKRTAHRIPDGWNPSLEDRRFALDLGLDPDAVAANFRDYWIGTGKPMADWSATWRNWCRRQNRDGSAGRSSPPVGGPGGGGPSPKPTTGWGEQARQKAELFGEGR